MRRRALASALALTTTVSILAGCGSSGSGGGSGGGGSNNSSGTPAAELTSAIEALGNASTIDATLKVGTTGSQLLSFVKQQDPATNLTAAQANEIAGAALEFEVAAPSGKTLSEASGASSGAANISISVNGSPLFTIRVVNQTLYLQVALKDLLDSLGKSSTYAQIQAAAGQLPGFVQALLQGKWVSLPESTAKSLTGSLGVPQSSPSANSSQASAFINALKSLLTTDVTVTRTSTGSTDVLSISGNTRTLAGDFTNALSSVPGAGAALSGTNLSKVPSKALTLTASVTGGTLSGLTVDAGQFAKSGKGSLPIELTLAKTGPSISAPSGATQIDTNELGSLLGSFAGGGL